MKFELAEAENYLIIEQDKILILSSGEIVLFEIAPSEKNVRRRESKTIRKEDIYVIKYYSNRNYIYIEYQKENSYIESKKLELKNREELTVVCSSIASNFQMNVANNKRSLIGIIILLIFSIVLSLFVFIAILFFSYYLANGKDSYLPYLGKLVALFAVVGVMRKVDITTVTTTLRSSNSKGNVPNYEKKFRLILNRLRKSILKNPCH